MPNMSNCQSNAFSKTSNGPFFLLSNNSTSRLGPGGINNLGGMRWRSPRTLRSSILRKSTTWLQLSLALVLCLFVILDSSKPVAGLPVQTSVSSRSHREYREAKQPHVPSTTTLHSLQGVDSGSSLSIVSPLDVLRQNMVLEIMRRRIRHAKQRQLQSNKEILDRIG